VNDQNEAKNQILNERGMKYEARERENGVGDLLGGKARSMGNIPRGGGGGIDLVPHPTKANGQGRRGRN